MAILVDDAIWPWRGRRWAHLVSDSHLDELHDFAHRLGMPYLAFQGDHYDIHSEMRDRALAAGAQPVTGREIVSALRGAGLRTRGGLEAWRWEWERTSTIDEVVALMGTHGALLGADLARVSTAGKLTAGLAARSAETVLVVSAPQQVEIACGLVVVDATATIHRSVGERGTYLEWRRTRP